MDRRFFLQTLTAFAAVPALPASSMAAVPINTASRMTVAQQLWASYFSTSKGQLALRSAQQTLGLTSDQARRVVMRSVAQAKTPAAIAARSAAAAHVRPVLNAVKRVDLTKILTNRLPDELRNLRALVACDCDRSKPEAGIDQDENCCE